MLQPIYDKNRRGQVSQVKALPFPWKGLDLRSRLKMGNPEYGLIIDNFIVENSEGRLRDGYSAHATAMPAEDTESLMVYSGGGVDKLFAASDGKVYDVSSAGDVGSAAISSLNGNRWIDVMYATTSGTYLVMANGEDSVRHFNGTTWATPTITGVTSADLTFVSAHKGRLWFVEKNTLSAWYLATNAVAGAATEFPIGAICKRGGTMTAIGTWSSDTGEGLDDRIVFVTSEGEVIIYQGNNPASDYSLVGIFQIDRPVSNRCLAREGGDLVIFTLSGPVPCSELVVANDAKNTKYAENVRPAFVDLWRDYSARFGWQAYSYNTRGWVMFNCPVNVGSETAYQYVINNGAWFRFRYMPALCWAEMAGNLYFGAVGGGVYHADNPAADGDNGEGIIGDVQWSWWHYGTPAKKRFSTARMYIVSDVSPQPQIEMSVDYSSSNPTNEPVLSTADGATWDVSPWDETAWAGSFFTFQQWIGLFGVGQVGALRFRVQTKGQELYRLQTIFVAFEPGGIM